MLAAGVRTEKHQGAPWYSNGVLGLIHVVGEAASPYTLRGSIMFNLAIVESQVEFGKVFGQRRLEQAKKKNQSKPDVQYEIHYFLP
jgi:hypothetical protein